MPHQGLLPVLAAFPAQCQSQTQSPSLVDFGGCSGLWRMFRTLKDVQDFRGYSGRLMISLEDFLGYSEPAFSFLVAEADCAVSGGL